jgi:hypothetical protein
VAQALAAGSAYVSAVNAYQFAENGATSTEHNATGNGDAAGARAAVQQELNACEKFLTDVAAVSFPTSMDTDVRGLISAANNLCGSEGQVVHDPNDSDFNNLISAVNQNVTMLGGADQLVRRDLETLIS